MPSSPAARAPFSQAMLYAGIFLIFGSLGILVGMSQPQPGGPGFAIAVIPFSGLIALGWAYAFSTRRYWLLIPLNLLPFFARTVYFVPIARTGLLGVGMDLSVPLRQFINAVLIVVLVSIGFICIVMYTRRAERVAQRARVELDVARRVHDFLVPSINLHSPLAHVLGVSQPSSEMGGDLIDAIPRDGPEGPELDVFLADVSGHGVGAGIVMAMLKSSIRSLLLSAPSLDRVLTDANVVLEQLTRPEMFATLACLRLRAGQDAHVHLEFALAGHLPIWLYRAGHARIDELANEHLPLGIEPSERFHAGLVAMHAGDTALLFTDGLIEVQSSGGKELGLDALRAVFAQHATKPLDQLAQALFAVARSHGTQLDDQSIVLVRAL